ncbi:MAG: response regulator [Geobacter sp.]|nr:MAG: response regulator [Geobacter sp.]
MENILLVDDDKDFLWLLKNLLACEGMTVLSSGTAEEALRELRGKTFDLVITDLDLPGLDGFALAQKALKLAPGMPVIMITGSIEPGISELAKKVGIAAVLFKPFHPDKLFEVVKNIIKSQINDVGRREPTNRQVNPKQGLP